MTDVPIVPGEDCTPDCPTETSHVHITTTPPAETPPRIEVSWPGMTPTPRPDLQVIHSATLSCGCRLPPSGPIPLHEAAGPGRVVICDVHEEYAIIVRATHRLVVDRETASSLLVEAGVLQPAEAAAVAAEQFPAAMEGKS